VLNKKAAAVVVEEQNELAEYNSLVQLQKAGSHNLEQLDKS